MNITMRLDSELQQLIISLYLVWGICLILILKKPTVFIPAVVSSHISYFSLLCVGSVIRLLCCDPSLKEVSQRRPFNYSPPHVLNRNGSAHLCSVSEGLNCHSGWRFLSLTQQLLRSFPTCTLERWSWNECIANLRSIHQLLRGGSGEESFNLKQRLEPNDLWPALRILVLDC